MFIFGICKNSSLELHLIRPNSGLYYCTSSELTNKKMDQETQKSFTVSHSTWNTHMIDCQILYCNLQCATKIHVNVLHSLKLIFCSEDYFHSCGHGVMSFPGRFQSRVLVYTIYDYSSEREWAVFRD